MSSTQRATSYSHDFASGLLPNPLEDSPASNEGMDGLEVTARSGTAVKSGSLSEDFRVSVIKNVTPLLSAVESFQNNRLATWVSMIVLKLLWLRGAWRLHHTVWPITLP